jgi:hypothetical protein
MILFVHILIGAVIALNINFLPLGLILAFLSHYILDALPHWDYSIKNIKERNWRYSLVDFLKVFLDMFFGFLLIFLLSKNFILAFIGGFLGILQDGFNFLTIVFPKKSPSILFSVVNFSKRIHFPENKKNPLFLGIFIELSVTIIAIYSLL